MTATRRPARPRTPIVVIVVALLGTFVPIYWMLSTAVKPSTEVASIPATLWPQSVTFSNFVDVWQDGTIPSASLRSLIIAVTTTACVLVLGSLSAYAATHLRYRYGGQMLTLSFLTQLLPQAATLVPIFILWRNLGLIDSLPGIVLAYIGFQLPVAVWIITGHFAAVPREVVEAAQIDGSSALRTLFSVVVPMSAAGLAAVAIWAIIGCWSELLFALVLLPGRLQTVSVALAGMVGQHTTNWGAVLAASTIAALPPLVLFFVLQRYFTDGIAGAVKG